MQYRLISCLLCTVKKVRELSKWKDLDSFQHTMPTPSILVPVFIMHCGGGYCVDVLWAGLEVVKLTFTHIQRDHETKALQGNVIRNKVSHVYS